MKEKVNQEIDKAQRAIKLSVHFLEKLKNLDPQEFSSSMRENVLKVADLLDEHEEQGRPYLLTFFMSGFPGWRPTQKLSEELRKELEIYLAYQFHTIWGKSWIRGEATRLRKLMELVIEE